MVISLKRKKQEEKNAVNVNDLFSFVKVVKKFQPNVNVQRGNTVVIGRKLYDYYQNLLAYENVRNRKCA